MCYTCGAPREHYTLRARTQTDDIFTQYRRLSSGRVPVNSHTGHPAECRCHQCCQFEGCSLSNLPEAWGACAKHYRENCRECANIPAPHDWGFVDLGSLATLPPPTFTVPGLAVTSGVSILFSASGGGKTTMVYSMLKAMTPGGPPFLGIDLDPIEVMLYTEEDQLLIGERVRFNQIPVACHVVNTGFALARPPDQFMAEAFEEYHRHGSSFGMIVIDTLTSFVNIQESNSLHRNW